MDLRGYLLLLRRSVPLVLIAGTLVGALTYAAMTQVQPLYESRARVIASSAQSDSGEAYAGLLVAYQRVRGYTVLVDSQLLGDAVKDDLGLVEPIEDLQKAVSAEVVAETPVLELAVQDPDPERAQAIAQSYATNLVKAAREIETPDEGAIPIKLTVIDTASLPEAPVSPKMVRNTGFGFVIGALLGLTLALLRQLLDTTIKSPEDISEVTEVAVIGGFLKEGGASKSLLISALNPQSARVEAFRVLRTHLQFVDVDAPTKVFVVSSPLQGEGKTSTAVNLAITMARSGTRTLLVDGDLRRPRIAEEMGLDGSVGLTTVLLGKVSLEEAVQRAEDGLDVLSSGISPPNPAELFQSKAMATLVAKMRADYDVVLFDSPPLLPVTDAALLAAQSDGALLVVRHGRTRSDALTTSLERLEAVDAKAIGVVLNLLPTGRRGALQYGAYGNYGEYRSRDPRTSGRRGAKRERGRGRRGRI